MLRGAVQSVKKIPQKPEREQRQGEHVQQFESPHRYLHVRTHMRAVSVVRTWLRFRAVSTSRVSAVRQGERLPLDREDVHLCRAQWSHKMSNLRTRQRVSVGRDYVLPGRTQRSAGVSDLRTRKRVPVGRDYVLPGRVKRSHRLFDLCMRKRVPMG